MSMRIADLHRLERVALCLQAPRRRIDRDALHRAVVLGGPAALPPARAVAAAALDVGLRADTART